MKQDRTGMIREIQKIKAMPMPDHMRAKSVRPAKKLGSSILASQAADSGPATLDSPRAASPKSSYLTSPTYRSIQVGHARFKTPAPARPLSIVDDPLRYLKQQSNDQKESIQDYVDSARKMLQFNVSILDKQQQVDQLREMIRDEEQKLNVAKKAFEEDTQRFNTFLFEARQVGDRLEEQFKEKNEESRGLEMQAVELKTKIEDVDAEIQFKEEECAKYKQNMEFLDWLIKQYRPRLVKEEGLEPLPLEVAERILEKRRQRAGDGVFMTQQEEAQEPKAGQLIEQPDFDNMELAGVGGYSIQKSIPVSHTDVHRFIAETCEENLFLINLNNKEQEQKDKMTSSNNAEIEKLTKQINQTTETIKVLNERKDLIQTKIRIKEQGLAQKRQSNSDIAGQTRKSFASAKSDKKSSELAEDPLYPQLIERIIGLYLMLYDPKTPGAMQSATTQAIL